MAKQASTSKQEKTLIFLHIPKTAGSTLDRVIDYQYNLKQIVKIKPDIHGEQINQVKNLSNTQKKKIQVIKGHTYFGWHGLLPQPCTYFTLLRNPVERFISNYYYILKRKDHLVGQILREQKTTMEEFARWSGEDNYQTRFLSKTIGEIDLNINTGNCTRDMLEQAKRNLRENCAVVGIVEEFDKTLLLLKKNFGWKNIFYKVRNQNNQRPSTSVISQKTLSLIAEKNKLDLELYQYANYIFQSLVKKCNLSEKEVREFQNTNESSFGQFSAFMSSSVNKIQKTLTVNRKKSKVF